MWLRLVQRREVNDVRVWCRLTLVAGKPPWYERRSEAPPQALDTDVHAREAMTGTLVYAEAFWRHDCVGLREPHA